MVKSRLGPGTWMKRIEATRKASHWLEVGTTPVWRQRGAGSPRFRRVVTGCSATQTEAAEGLRLHDLREVEVERRRLAPSPRAPRDVGQRQGGVTTRVCRGAGFQRPQLSLDPGRVEPPCQATVRRGGEAGDVHRTARASAARGRCRARRCGPSRSRRSSLHWSEARTIAASIAKRPSPAAAAVASARPARRRPASQRAAIDLVEGKTRARIVDTTGPAGQAEPDHGAQAPRLGVGRVGGDDGIGDREGLPSGVGERRRPDRARSRWATVNMPEHTGEHDRQSPLALHRIRDAEAAPSLARARLARVSRAAAAVSWTPRWPAICGTVSPQTTRRASTMREAGERASSQATKSSARRSSRPARERSSASMGCGR